MEDFELQKLIFLIEPESVLKEVRELCQKVSPNGDFSLVWQTHEDVCRIFAGEYPGFQKCNTLYHDLAHTLAVFLTTARLIHGAHCLGHKHSDETIELALVSALFHDVGLIQEVGDTEGTGAKYTIGHEDRSVKFLLRYLAGQGRGSQNNNAVRQIIDCTKLDVKIADIAFDNREIEWMGKILGTADLVSQFADRIYLEKLLFLYREFREAGIVGYRNELELLQKSDDFYQACYRDRLQGDFKDVIGALPAHFKAYRGLDRDLYQEYVEKNREYLSLILNEYREDYRNKLRRAAVTDQLDEG